MKTLIALVVLLFLSSATFAADPAPQCVEEKITIQKLLQQNAQLMPFALQAQLTETQKAAEAAKGEEARLEKLLPKKPEEKSTPSAPPK